jgi:hypothetical protein
MAEISGSAGPYADQQSYGMTAEKRPAPAQVDIELADELRNRMETAASEACWNEEQAARWRNVQRACDAALQQIIPNDSPVPYSPPR